MLERYELLQETIQQFEKQNEEKTVDLDFNFLDNVIPTELIFPNGKDNLAHEPTILQPEDSFSNNRKETQKDKRGRKRGSQTVKTEKCRFGGSNVDVDSCEYSRRRTDNNAAVWKKRNIDPNAPKESCPHCKSVFLKRGLNQHLLKNRRCSELHKLNSACISIYDSDGLRSII